MIKYVDCRLPWLFSRKHDISTQRTHTHTQNQSFIFFFLIFFKNINYATDGNRNLKTHFLNNSAKDLITIGKKNEWDRGGKRKSLMAGEEVKKKVKKKKRYLKMRRKIEWELGWRERMKMREREREKECKLSKWIKPRSSNWPAPHFTKLLRKKKKIQSRKVKKKIKERTFINGVFHFFFWMTRKFSFFFF